MKGGTLAISAAAAPMAAQTVIDDKTAVGVLYVVAVCGFCYGAGVLVTTIRNRQKEASDSILRFLGLTNSGGGGGQTSNPLYFPAHL